MTWWRRLPPWVVFGLGCALGVALTVTLQGVASGRKIPEGLGGLFGGLAALSGAAAAWAGFSRWEDRHRRELQATVAGEALIAASDIVGPMRMVARDQYTLDPDVGHVMEADKFAEWVKLMEEPGRRERYESARRRTEAFLPGDAGVALEALWELHRQLIERLEVSAHFTDGHGLHTDASIDVIKGFDGPELETKITTALEAVRMKMKPFAWLE